MLKQMYKLYTRHSFEHMLFQYMHSHYLVVESKETDNGSDGREVLLGDKGKKPKLIGSRLKPGMYNVKDPNENIRYQVHVRQVGAPLRRTIDQV